MIENFDIINIEYMENGEETFDYPEEMLVSVETRKDDSIDHTKDSIRAKIKSYIGRNFGNDVEVVDFLAFPVGSNIQLGQLSFEFDAETFEAREKMIGSITIKKNPNFPSGTSLQAYIKTNRAELRKVFGNPNMGESSDGKSKGKEWNLVVGNHRVTIYDKREKDKKGTKYFNIGGNRKYAALKVAQALSIHRNERVYAKEIVPQWLEDERRYQQVKSIDEHPDLTYHRAKEYEDNRGYYGAETFDVEFNEWAEQEMMSHGKDISFKDWAEDEGMKHGNVPITEWAEHEEESHDARYGAEDWGGNPKGRLARALQKARENAKKPKKPLKIEKLDAETFEANPSYYRKSQAGIPTPMSKKANKCFICSKPATRERGFTNRHLTSDGEGTKPRITGEDGSIWFCKEHDNLYDFGLFSTGNILSWTHPNGTKYVQGRLLKDAETSGQWEIGEQLEEAQMNAEGKKKKKLSGQLSDPFDELSLDSGDWKGIVAGFGIGLLALFGYSKLRK